MPLGTDYLGRDLLRGLLKGGGPTLTVGAAAASDPSHRHTLGGVAGYFGGWIDDLLMRVTEFFQVLPALLFAMVVITLFSPSAHHHGLRHRHCAVAADGAPDAGGIPQDHANSNMSPPPAPSARATGASCGR